MFLWKAVPAANHPDRSAFVWRVVREKTPRLRPRVPTVSSSWKRSLVISG